ncbi:DUF3618 domain-containing protein [Lentzea sp. NBRC 102530]|uniref:DUF3618 domain-containing protein n=1 Tax=Lentzea sp. NBRC 102530 TaxID=3032201 RepID=UPI0024A2ECB5|nr:DUF3618 domain-containing protein [Lentzea sp. NBRC 102530]GLY50740.1 hypothetical protein Lesp01_43960 [Lentzea sp. NBRC 102530]
MSDEKKQLQAEVERTRRELGETVEALAHKVDVPSRVKEQAQETKLKVTAATNDAIDSVSTATANAIGSATAATNKAIDSATAATNHAIDSLPDPVAEQVEKARRHPGAIAAALIALVLAIWAISRRNR